MEGALRLKKNSKKQAKIQPMQQSFADHPNIDFSQENNEEARDPGEAMDTVERFIPNEKVVTVKNAKFKQRMQTITSPRTEYFSTQTVPIDYLVQMINSAGFAQDTF